MAWRPRNDMEEAPSVRAAETSASTSRASAVTELQASSNTVGGLSCRMRDAAVDSRASRYMT